MNVRGGAPCGPLLAGIRWARLIEKCGENCAFGRRVGSSFSIKPTGSVPSAPSGRPRTRRLFLRFRFSASSALNSSAFTFDFRICMSSWCSLCTSSVVEIRRSASPTRSLNRSMSRRMRAVSSWTRSILMVRVDWQVEIACIRASNAWDPAWIAPSGGAEVCVSMWRALGGEGPNFGGVLVCSGARSFCPLFCTCAFPESPEASGDIWQGVRCKIHTRMLEGDTSGVGALVLDVRSQRHLGHAPGILLS